MKKTIRDLNFENKKVVIRCDLNVPIKDNVILDDTRIIKSLDTINYIINKNAKVILMSHLGRIETIEDKKTNSLKIVQQKLSEYLNVEVKFCDETSGKKLEKMINDLKEKEVLLIENTRFEDINNKKESSNNEELGKYWASLFDIFVNDAYGSSHRAHASTYGIPKYIPSCIGFLVEKEINALTTIISENKKPFIVILGGAKVKDKIGLIKNLIDKVDNLLIGGGMSYTFLKAIGYEIGNSLLDEESINFCKEILLKNKNKIILPVDINTGLDYDPNTKTRISNINEINKNEMGLDIGEKTIELFGKYINNSKTIIWNGPLGVFEFEKFSNGTKKICEKLENSTAKILIGGGDTASAVNKFGNKEKYYHISTGGGATLEFLEGKELPGISIIENK